MSELTLLFVCSDQLFNKLVGNKSSSLPHLHLFKAKGGRVTRPVQSLFQICNKTGFTVHTGAKLADAQSQLSAALQLQAGSHVSKDSIFLQKKKLKIGGRGGE